MCSLDNFDRLFSGSVSNTLERQGIAYASDIPRGRGKGNSLQTPCFSIPNQLNSPITQPLQQSGFRPMTDHQPRHVFISYVRENQEQVDRLCQDLESHGVNVWLDRHSIKPGSDFRDAIRGAIQEGHFFIACFSNEYTSKAKTYMNNELMVAIDELRQYTRPWFIPVKLSKCEVPNLRISSDKTLKDLQYVELHEDWDAGINDILSVIKPFPPEIQNLTSALRSEDRDVRGNAVRALRKIGPAAVPALVEALKDKDENVREAATRALARIGPKAKAAAVPALIEVLKDENEVVRQLAAEALGKIGPEAMPTLIEALKDEDENVRWAAALGLGYIGPEAKAAVPALIKALTDVDRNVREIAAAALGEIGTKAKLAVPALSEALKDENYDVRVAAAEALAKIGPEAKPAAANLIVALKDDDGNVRRYAAKALKKINTPEARKALEEYYKKSN